MEKYVEFKNVSKSFPGVKALTNVGFKAYAGMVCAFLGENGAGKSTMLRILNGDIRQDDGSVIINGESVNFTSPRDALEAGISMIYQERQLMPMLTVMENIFVGNLPGNAGIISRKKLQSNTQELLDKFGIPIQPTDLVGRLSVAYQQMVEIMKAYRRNSEIIVLDEPTSSLTDKEVKILFDIIRQLRSEGKIIIYVSHRMAEIFDIADHVVVLKDGHLVLDCPIGETDRNKLISAMVGRDIGDTYADLKRNENISSDIILEVNNLTTEDVFNINFNLRRGEILGFAGLVGAGRTEVVRAIFGADKIKSGMVRFEGKEVYFKAPRNAVECGIALCPEDRKEQGLFLNRTVLQNITAPILKKICNLMFLNRKREAEITNAAVKRYTIRTPSIDKTVMELSGGNQQKIILGRWTSEDVETKLLILDEPTKGIDVGSKAEIYQMVCDLARSGMSIIYISSELTEVINVCDRIVVMQEGRINGIVNRGPEATEESVLALAMREK